MNVRRKKILGTMLNKNEILIKLEKNRNYFIRFLIKDKKASFDEAEIMFSDLKIKTIQALDKGSLKYNEKKFNSWARETMKNAFIDYVRKILSREDTTEGRKKYHSFTKFFNGEEYNFSYENVLTIEQCIKRLPDKLRKIMNLRIKGISTQSDISKAMKMKEGTVAGLCLEAMQKFRNCLYGSLEVTY